MGNLMVQPALWWGNPPDSRPQDASGNLEFGLPYHTLLPNASTVPSDQ